MSPKLHRTFTMPGLPPKELNPNSRLDRHVVAAAKAQARSDMIAVVREQGWFGPGMLYATLGITFVATDRIHRDYDNLLAACKGWIDGLVDADVLQYDDTTHLKMNLDYRVDVDGEARTVFELKERA